jgi:hypothetical protein
VSGSTLTISSTTFKGTSSGTYTKS